MDTTRPTDHSPETRDTASGVLLTEVDADAGWGGQPVDSTYYACCYAHC